MTEADVQEVGRISLPQDEHESGLDKIELTDILANFVLLNNVEEKEQAYREEDVLRGGIDEEREVGVEQR